MVTIKEIVSEDHAYLLPIGDCHLGDAFFTRKSEHKLRGYIDWVKQTPNSRVFLNGDIFNVATRISKTSPFDKNQWVGDEMNYAIELFKPIAHQIIGATDGNHEWRLIDFANLSLVNYLCDKLSDSEHKIIYCGVSCLLFLKVGRPLARHRKIKDRTNPNRSQHTYSIYLHHTTGGGTTIGGKMNRVDKLRQIVAGCDCYCGSHNHLEGAVKNRIYLPDHQNCVVKEIRQMEVDCGGFLDYGGYAERGMLPPTDIGVPRIRFGGGDKKDIHISL